LFDIDYLSVFKKLAPHLPILFIFSNFDSVVPAYEVLDFYNAYSGPKDLCEIYRTHDEDRPDDLFRQGLMWLTRQKKQGKTSLLQAR
jgi:cephalosporin-C deacetylase-like acetyl esterase